MPELALALYVVMLVVAFGWRSYMPLRRMGAVGSNGISGAPGPAAI